MSQRSTSLYFMISLLQNETLTHLRLTPESSAALAVEHLGLLHLAFSTVLAGVRLTGVVPAFANSAAENAVAVALLKVEHPVVDVQHSDAAHQARGDPCPFPHAEETKRCIAQSHLNVQEIGC